MYEKLKQRWARQKSELNVRGDIFKRQLLEKGTPIFKKYNLQTVYLFGSLAAGISRPDSDIDLYVSALPIDRYWDFRHELEEAIQLPIDLYTDSDDLGFVQKIVERGEKIYGL